MGKVRWRGGKLGRHGEGMKNGMLELSVGRHEKGGKNGEGMVEG